jgi:hypothetical protein
MRSIKKGTDGVPCKVPCRNVPDVLDFMNITWFHDTRVNVISLTPLNTACTDFHENHN